MDLGSSADRGVYDGQSCSCPTFLLTLSWLFPSWRYHISWWQDSEKGNQPNQPGSRKTCEAGNSEIKCRRGIEYLMSTRTCHHCHQALFMDPLCVPITNTNGRHLQSYYYYYYHDVMFIVYSELVLRPHNRDIKLVMGVVTKVQCLVLTSTTPPPARPRWPRNIGAAALCRLHLELDIDIDIALDITIVI